LPVAEVGVTVAASVTAVPRFARLFDDTRFVVVAPEPAVTVTVALAVWVFASPPPVSVAVLVRVDGEVLTPTV
jgi:hypothetical protein